MFSFTTYKDKGTLVIAFALYKIMVENFAEILPSLIPVVYKDLQDDRKIIKVIVRMQYHAWQDAYKVGINKLFCDFINANMGVELRARGIKIECGFDLLDPEFD